MTSDRRGEGGGGGVSEKLTKVDIGGRGGSLTKLISLINPDALKGWGREKPK